MQHVKELKRASGQKVRITITLRVNWWGTNWDFKLEVCPPRGRTWREIAPDTEILLRRLNQQERGQWLLAKHLEHVTLAELNEAQTEAWHKLKPPAILPPGQTPKTKDNSGARARF